MKLVVLSVALSAASTLAAGQHSMDVIRGTPCLLEYRLWQLEDFRKRSTNFVRPPEFTEEQCEEAVRVNDRIPEMQEREQAEDDARRARDEKRGRDAAASRAAKVKAEREAKRRLPGVSIGMSASDVVLRSNWGAPDSRNRTTTATGTREQWVYGPRQYLYFENGRLVAIQD